MFYEEHNIPAFIISIIFSNLKIHTYFDYIFIYFINLKRKDCVPIYRGNRKKWQEKQTKHQTDDNKASRFKDLCQILITQNALFCSLQDNSYTGYHIHMYI